MLANVLNSERAIAMSVKIVREFVRLRSIARSDCPLREKLRQLERAVKSRWTRHETQIDELFEAVQNLIDDPGGAPARKQIGFVP